MKWFVKLLDTDWVEVLLRLYKRVVKLLYTFPLLVLLWYTTFLFSGLILNFINHWFIPSSWEKDTNLVTGSIFFIFCVNVMYFIGMGMRILVKQSTCPPNLKHVSLKSLISKLQTVGLTKGFLE